MKTNIAIPNLCDLQHVKFFETLRILRDDTLSVPECKNYKQYSRIFLLDIIAEKTNCTLKVKGIVF